MDYKPSYDEYRKIIGVVKQSGKLKDYTEAKDAEEFIVLRHDVEFSLERAYKMAQIEQSGGGCQHPTSFRLQTMHIMHYPCRIVN